MAADEPEVKAEETKEEEKQEAKPVEYEGACAGKYKFGDDHKPVEVDQGAAITAYSWSDGKKRVSIYVELDGLDALADDKITHTSGETEVSLTIEVGGKARKLALSGLFAEIDGCKMERKMGKNMVVLKLQKKEEKSWYKLQAAGGGGGGGDDDDDGGMGGMGGMGGGMGGMDMASMMAGMGG